MKRICYFLTTSALLLLASCAKVLVVPVPNSSTIKAEGVFYALPKTVARAVVNVDKSEAKAGTYMRYAEVFTPDGSPVCKSDDCGEENKKRYSLQKNVVFTTFGEPDPANVYMVKFVGRGAVDQNIAMAWTETGLLSTASASVTNRTTDVIVSGLKLAAGLGAKTGFGAVSAPPSGEAACPGNTPSIHDAWILKALLDQSIPLSTGPILAGNYCKLPKERRDDGKYEQNSSGTLFLSALSAYVKNVAPLIDTRTKILSGAQGIFEPTELLTKVEALLDQQTKTLFLGSKSSKTWAGTIDIRDLPLPGVEPGMAVLHIDAEKGFCIGTGTGSSVLIAPDAKPFPEGFGNLLSGADCANATAINLVTRLSPANQLFQSIQEHTSPPTGELGFRYRIPAQVKAELKHDDTSYGSGVFSVAQFGMLAALPANRHSKALSYDLAMVEATGGLKSFKIGTTGAVDSGTMDSLSGIGGTLLDARNASAKADKASKDELTTLTRQDTLLKLQDDICTLQKKYGLDCTVQP